MPAPPQFAVVFFTHYNSIKRRTPALRDALSAALERRLPADAVAACAPARGLFGTPAGGGSLAELDPSQVPDAADGGAARARSHGVSVLLGRLPGARVQAFALPAVGPPPTLRSAVSELAGAGWLPASLLLLMAPPASSAASVSALGKLELLARSHPWLPVAGGVASMQNGLLCFRGSSDAVPTAAAFAGLLVSRPAAPLSRPLVAAALAAEGQLAFGPVAADLALRPLGVSPDGSSLGVEVHSLGGLWEALVEDQEGDTTPSLGVWLAPRTAAASPTNSYAAAAAAGNALRLDAQKAMIDMEANQPIILALSEAVQTKALLSRLESDPGLTLCGQLLRFNAAAVRAELQRSLPGLAALRPPPPALLPPPCGSGLVAVACCAKGLQLHDEQGAEAAALQAALGSGTAVCGAFMDGEIGHSIPSGLSTLRVAPADEAAVAQRREQGQAGDIRLSGFTSQLLLLGA